MRSSLRAGALLALLVALGSEGAAGQSALRSARMIVDLEPDDGAAEVRIDYVLALDGATEVRFELLGFGDAVAEGFWVGERRTGAPIMLTRETGSMWATTRTLSFGEEASDVTLRARYLIQRAVERSGENLRVHVPVLAVSLPPAGADDVFRAEVLVPEVWSVSEGFPSGLRAREDGVYEVELPVLPSVVSLRARADGAWRPGLPFAIDVLAGIVLLGFGILGWRHLRGVAAAARTRDPVNGPTI